MFIPESEAENRLEREENLVNRLERKGSVEVSSFILPGIPSGIPDLASPENSEPSAPALIGDENCTPIGITRDSRNGEKERKSYAEKTVEKLLSDDPLSIEQGFDRLISGYKGRGTKNLHRDVQAGIGVAADFLGTTKASRLGDVAISSAHSYERGFTSPTDLVNPLKPPKAELQERIIQGHGIIVDKCFNRLLKTLNLLDDEKLSGVKKATELSLIAKNLSSIVNHATAVTQDKLVENNEKSVHFHIMKPPMAQEDEYPVIQISEEESPE